MQLAGGHVDSNVNNPNENIGQWKAGQVQAALRVLPGAPRQERARRSTATWAGATSRPARKPACRSTHFQMPRTVWLPAGVPADAVAFYADVLKKVSETPEWKEYRRRAPSQTGRFLTGEELQDFIAEDEAEEPQGLRGRRLGREVSSRIQRHRERRAGRVIRDARIAPSPRSRIVRDARGGCAMITRFCGRDRHRAGDAGLRPRHRLGALEFGIGWESAGPEPGAFPFYVGAAGRRWRASARWR